MKSVSGNMIIRREIKFPPGINKRFITGLTNRIIQSYLDRYHPEKLNNTELFNWELSVSLVDNAEIQDINKRFRKVNHATDVLTFPQYESGEIDEIISNSTTEFPVILGDLVISLEWLAKKGKGNPIMLRNLFAWVTVHGLLHILGFDHNTKEKEKLMQEEEERILAKLGKFISGSSKSGKR
jgi:probable rRNA maturation factor